MKTNGMLLNPFEYVKEVPEGWEVKLGAGIVPVIITQFDIDNARVFQSTATIPYNMTQEEYVRYLDAVAKVNEYLATEKAEDA